MNLVFDPTPLTAPEGLPLEMLADTRARIIDPALREAFVASDQGAAQLDRLFGSDALCVTTGQQPGLFTGPLFTIYKALTAVTLARRCEARLGRPVVPVFWVAGDDHDLAEAGHTSVLNLDNELVRLALPDRPGDAPLTPLYRERLGENVDDVVNTLTTATPPTEYRDATLEWLTRHYRTGNDLATAFAGALAELLGPSGLVVLRPTHPAVKAAMRSLLMEALRRAEDLEHALTARTNALTATGTVPPVPVGGGATLVMLEGDLGRDRLVADNGRFHARRSGAEYRLAELEALAQDAPERFSPNVLLRPVVEAALLPTVAYVAGPGELAYFPQCDPIFDMLRVAPQAPVPRWSARIIEQRVRKVLDKFAIRPEDLVLPDGQLEQRLVQDEMPAAARDALSELRGVLPAPYQALTDAAIAVDPTLKKPVESARAAAFRGLDDLEKRLVSHLKQNNQIRLQQVAKARRNLYPGGKPQERVLSAVPFLIRYGRAFLDAATEAADAWTATLVSTSAKP